MGKIEQQWFNLVYYKLNEVGVRDMNLMQLWKVQESIMQRFANTELAFKNRDH